MPCGERGQRESILFKNWKNIASKSKFAPGQPNAIFSEALLRRESPANKKRREKCELFRRQQELERFKVGDEVSVILRSN